MDAYQKYLPVSEPEKSWGLYVLCAGCARVNGAGPYPLQNHPPHHHFNWNKGRILQEYQIIYITKGEGFFESKTAGKINIAPGTVILLFPGEWHRYKPDKHVGWDEYWIGMSGAIMDNFVTAGFFSTNHPVINIGQSENLFKLLIDAIEGTKRENPGYQAIASGLIHSFLGNLYAFGKENRLRDQYIEDIITKAKILFRANIGNNYNAESVAKELKVGYSWFRKIFKLYTGMAPGQYYLQLKIQKAKELLAEPQNSVKNIALELNVESAFFSTIFKEKTGLSPIEYRAKYLNNLWTNE